MPPQTRRSSRSNGRTRSSNASKTTEKSKSPPKSLSRAQRARTRSSRAASPTKDSSTSKATIPPPKKSSQSNPNPATKRAGSKRGRPPSISKAPERDEAPAVKRAILERRDESWDDDDSFWEGREGTLRELESCLGGIPGGFAPFSTIVVHGDVGVGKSSLVETACRRSGCVWTRVYPEAASSSRSFLQTALAGLARSYLALEGGEEEGEDGVDEDGGVVLARGSGVGVGGRLEDLYYSAERSEGRGAKVLRERSRKRAAVMSGAVCDRFASFARAVRGLVERESEKPAVVVVDDAEALNDLDVSLGESFLRLGDLCGRRVVAVLVGSSPSAVLGGGGGSGALVPAVAAAKTDALVAAGGVLLLRVGRPSEAVACRSAALRLFRRVATAETGLSFEAVLALCRYAATYIAGAGHTNPREIFQMASKAFPVFASTLREHTDDAMALARATRAAGEVLETARSSALGGSISLTTAAPNPNNTASTIELPYLTQFLLLSIFIAGRNPPETDARFFTRGKSHTSKRGRSGRARKGARPTAVASAATSAGAVSAAPKFVPWERILAIFHALVAAIEGPQISRNAGSIQLLQASSSLEQLGLVQSNTAKDPAAIAFRSTQRLDDATNLAKELRVDLAHYLYNPEIHH